MPNCKTKIRIGDHDVSLLTWTSDMQCWSFSLPALDSCPMAVTTTDKHICSGCYAMIGNYNRPNVLNAQYSRFFWTKKCLETDPSIFISTMSDAILKHSDKRFRVHDSGDLFSPAYIKAWTKICKNIPDIKFWFPTRSWQATSKNWTNSLTALAELPNVTVKPSALCYDESPPAIEWLSAGTSVYESLDKKERGVLICPKTLIGGSCDSNNCTACWNKNTKVAYLIHGRQGRHKASPASLKELSKRQEFKSRFTKLTISIG